MCELAILGTVLPTTGYRVTLSTGALLAAFQELSLGSVWPAGAKLWVGPLTPVSCQENISLLRLAGLPARSMVVSFTTCALSEDRPW